MMISPLQASSRSYANSANEMERILVDHEWAMICRDLEEIIEVGLGLFSSYERIDSRWRAGVRRGDPAYPVEDGLELREIAYSLTESRQKVLHLIHRIELKGYVPEGSIQYRSMAFVPFDERPLDVHFSDSELHNLATVVPKAPEVPIAEDDSEYSS